MPSAAWPSRPPKSRLRGTAPPRRVLGDRRSAHRALLKRFFKVRNVWLRSPRRGARSASTSGAWTAAAKISTAWPNYTTPLWSPSAQWPVSSLARRTAPTPTSALCRHTLTPLKPADRAVMRLDRLGNGAAATTGRRSSAKSGDVDAVWTLQTQSGSEDDEVTSASVSSGDAAAHTPVGSYCSTSTDSRSESESVRSTPRKTSNGSYS